MSIEHRKLNLQNTVTHAALHAMALAGLVVLWGGIFGAGALHGGTIPVAVSLYALNALALVCGLHALWSHRGYKTVWPVEAVWLFFSTLGLTGSAYWWARDHRIHHAFQDSDRDPHNIREGFFYAHIGWLLFKKTPAQIAARQSISLVDLERNALVMWQHRHYRLIAIPLALGLPALVCGLGWGDWLGGLLVAGALRIVFFLHCVFCVNSVAHTFGARRYAPAIRAADNFLVSLLLVGVGHHNYHHKYPTDYRNAPNLAGWNPGAWLIWGLAKVHLAWDLRATDQPREAPPGKRLSTAAR
jgi:stearoyl-CoA desaturase (delta-9 desaturase)